MTSKLIVNSIRHTGASADAITMDASGNVTFPANATCSGTASGFGGITMATQWRVTSDFTIGTGDGDYVIASNWESVDTNSQGRIGSDLSQSSGIFSFPSTGIYRIFAITPFNNTSANNWRSQITIQVTTDNSSYETSAIAKQSLSTPAEQSGSMSCEYLFDVTNVSTHKFRIVVRTYADNVKFQGDTGHNETSISVIRIGDT